MTYCLSCMGEILKDFGVCPHCGFVKEQYIYSADMIAPETILDNRYYIGKAVYSDTFGISYVAFDIIMQRKIIFHQFFINNDTNLIYDIPQENYNFYNYQQREKFIKFYKQLALIKNVPSIPEIYTCRISDTIAYAVCEYISDKTLGHYISVNGAQNYDDAIKILFPVAQGLKAIHDKGMYHGLLSIKNLKFNEQGCLVINDFSGAEITYKNSNENKNSDKNLYDFQKNCIVIQNQRNDIKNFILIIVMLITGNISIDLNTINAKLLKNNNYIPENIQTYISSALDAEKNPDLMTIDCLINNIYNNIDIPEIKIKETSQRQIPKSLYETSQEVGRVIKSCNTSLDTDFYEPIEEQDDDVIVWSGSDKIEFPNE